MIYTITEFTKIEEDTITNLPTFGDRHCIGYYTDLQKAKSYVEKMEYETPYIIIEEIPEGIEKQTTKRWIYEWDFDNYIQIDEPYLIVGVTNFGIG